MLTCLNRGRSGEMSAKYLGIEIDETVKLRSELILSAIAVTTTAYFADLPSGN